MTQREKVIKGLECCVAYDYKCNDCPYQDDGGTEDGCYSDELKTDALALLKEHEKATIEPKRIDLEDETKAWLDKLDAVDALGNIADICIDWDGYRTANGLGGLINEVWAYARYCADRLAKAHEPMEPTGPDEDNEIYCGACGSAVGYEVIEPSGMDYVRYNYCPNCGKAVKWE